jgi:exopolyphosphatase/guanosine-5'-triphosphate,3'-diphosphate pyrophosphatase
MEGAVTAFASFRDQMKGLELHAFRAVTTSAVREAENGQELVDRVMDETGIELEMISGSEEARLVHLAVASRVDLTGGQWILTDLGGGSVEVSLVDDMGMLWTESHTMGSVRILEELSEAKSDPGGFNRLLTGFMWPASPYPSSINSRSFTNSAPGSADSCSPPPFSTTSERSSNIRSTTTVRL